MFPVQDKTVDGFKYAGRSRAIVIDNKDPQKRGRIRVYHPIVGETVWIPYLKTPGFFDVPSIDDVVYVEADCGFETHLVAWGNLVHGKEGDPQIPEEFQRDDPTNRGFYTPGGHLVELDDGESKGVRITASNGAIVHIDADADKITIKSNFGDELSISKDDGIQGMTPAGMGTSLSMKSGEVIIKGSNTTITANNDEFKVEDANGNTFQTNASGSTLEDSNGNSIETSSSGIKLTESTGAELNLTGGKVALKGTVGEVVALFEEFAQTLATDVFAGFGSPAGQAAKYQEIALKLGQLKA